MSETYYLMNKNDKILLFSIESTPLGASITELESFTEIRPIGFVKIDTWLQNRNYAKHKEHFRKWLCEWQINTIEGFINVTHCLSVNDSLWVKKSDSSLNWENVNLYDNEFSDVAEKTAFETGLFGLQLSSTKVQSPEFTSEGTCPKCWRREDKTISLYKAGLSGAKNVGLEPYCEYISSYISKQIYTLSIHYDLVKFKDKICSKCEIFTDTEHGYVPFYKILDASNYYDIAKVIKICDDMGFGTECRIMFLIDSIVFNQDRHLGNFGFIVDNNDFTIQNFAPLFDFNISMLCNAEDEEFANFQPYYDQIIGHKLGGKFNEVGQFVVTSEIKASIPRELYFPIHNKYNMTEQRCNKILQLLNKNFQNIMDDKSYKIEFKDDTKQRI